MFKLGNYENQIESAIRRFRPEVLESKSSMERLKKDIRHSYYVCKSSPDEYFLFGFGDKTPQERTTYLSDKMIYMSMAKTVGRKIHDTELEDKFKFYQIVGEYFKRDVCCVSSIEDYEDFALLARKHKRLILKPNDSACGHGIKIESFDDEKDVSVAFENMLNSGKKWIVEELIIQVPEMAVWNESSVNTVRLSTFLNSDGFHLLCPFMRMGRKGSIVDNGGQGGTYCCIDVETGKLLTDGKDERNNVYVAHPDSGIVYKGWQVPKWKELIELSEKIHRLLPKHKYVAWDFALTSKGWCVIEGNWGEFVCQQSCMERGYKEEFMKLINK